jgi:spore maturation protein SpmA
VNAVFFAIVLVAFVVTGVRQIAWAPDSPDAMSPMEILSASVVESAGGAVELAIGLVGMMALFLGLMKVAEAGGALTIIARTLRPVTVQLFPGVPPDHPAMGAIILNMSANAMGLGNAATPFGIRAMQELDKLNPHKGTASNAMVMLLAINTSAIALLPTGVISLRASVGSADPAGILSTTLFATCLSTVVAVTAAKVYQRFSPVPTASVAAPAIGSGSAVPGPAAPVAEGDLSSAATAGAYPGWVSALVMVAVITLIPLGVLYGTQIAPWVIPGLVAGLLTFGVVRGVRVYEVLAEGAKDGFQVAIRIIPYLVTILVAVAMLRASGALGFAVQILSPLTTPLGMPAEVLPVALLRPLSGTGAFGVMASVLQDPAIGPDSYMGYLASTLTGSTDTTFYILAVYFGAVQIRRTRHALAAGLTADLAGAVAAVIACSYLYGR